MRTLEILSPCGNVENFWAGVNAGANAVYLGMDKFNARMRADNISTNNLGEVVRNAHILGVKVYLTVNILIKDEEVEEFLKTIDFALKCGVDAFIIQDFGMANLLRDTFEGIELHASTQMGINSLAGAKFLEECGFSRVVLSRETPLETIKLIKENTNLEIEYFVQGAMCVAFSGNCYMSSVLLDKSGNRGECKQLCRLAYVNEENKKSYFLSMKDLCLYGEFKNLIDAGVTSFKIEGRLRRAGYVAKTTKIYADLLEAIEKENYSLMNSKKDIYDLKKVFSRGDFTEKGYLYENENDNICEIWNNHTGVEIGKVLSCEEFKKIYKVRIQINHNLKSGDGLKFYFNNKEKASVGVGNFNKIKENQFEIFTTKKIEKDWKIHLITDVQLEENALSLRRKRKLQLKIKLIENEKIMYEAVSENTNISGAFDFVLERAKNKATSVEEINEKLSQINDTNFEIEKIDVTCGNVFIPHSVLKNLKREIITKIEEKILNQSKNHIIFNEKKHLKIKEEAYANLSLKNSDIFLSNSVDELKKFKDIYEYLIYSPNEYNENTIQKIRELEQEKKGKICLDLPLIKTEKDFEAIKKILEGLDYSVGVFVNNYYAFELAKKCKGQIIVSPLLNVYNSFTGFYLKRQIENLKIVSSIEKTPKSNIDYVFRMGQYPLMHLYSNINFKSIKLNEDVFVSRDIKINSTIHQLLYMLTNKVENGIRENGVLDIKIK